MGATQTVLMGDPSCFRIRSGSNPHTRTRWGLRKKVNLPKAEKQWHTLARLFTDLGVRVVVLPPSQENPGTVFPANAGVLFQQRFYLGNLTPGRSGERPLYAEFLKRLGFPLVSLPFSFEGEADFIETPAGFLFTSGTVLKQCFVPQRGFPPYRRRYGFRSDARNHDALQRIVGEAKVIPLTLVDERFYHGDTLLCPFGSQNEFLLAYLPGLASDSQKTLLSLFQERLLPLDEGDAFRFAANGFQVEKDGVLHLVLPAGLSGALLRAIERRGIQTVAVDVSEFSEKGGGSVKCLLCRLGRVDLGNGPFTEEAVQFWATHSYLTHDRS